MKNVKITLRKCLQYGDLYYNAQYTHAASAKNLISTVVLVFFSVYLTTLAVSSCC